jgi:uncharacterized protein YndB with AHSA1/START domain
MATTTMMRGRRSTKRTTARTAAPARARTRKREDGQTLNRISSAAIAAATGKTWEQWMQLLDAAGAGKLDHKGIVKLVSQKFDVGPWWRQMLTVGYEQARGLRGVNQAAGGFQISVTKTLPVPMDRLFRAWSDDKRRARWLPDEITIRKSTRNRSVRITWNDGTNVEVMFYPQPSGTNRVNVQHNKLPTKAAAEKMRAFWKQRLEAMAELVARERS